MLKYFYEIFLKDIIFSKISFNKFSEQMNWIFYYLKLLRLYLNFKNNFFDKNFFKIFTLIRFFIIFTSQLPNIFLKMKMNSIFIDFKSLDGIILQKIIFMQIVIFVIFLISKFSLYPIGLAAFFAKFINIFTS